MNLGDFEKIRNDAPTAGSEMIHLMTKIYPICRSITGNGVRQTLTEIKNHIDLKIHEVPTGKKVFDWTVPKEWNIIDAYVTDKNGNRIIDFKKSNLHVVSYSIPIRKKLALAELKKHIHTIPEQPDLIPYLTSYYSEDWGFCMAHKDFEKLKDEEYDVVIDSTLKKGSLTYGEYYIAGKKTDEILISCYVCHPSLCNDNLSGIVLTTMLAKYLSKTPLEYSIRFLFIPETIGAITWLAINERKISKIKHGLVATCVGDSGISTYKRSRQTNTDINKVVEFVLKSSGSKYNVLDFFPSGSDERQFCSPGFNLPVGSLMRTPYARFTQYHTSGDDLSFVKAEFLADTYTKYLTSIFVLDNNKRYHNTNPKCEPQLGRRGLYRQLGAQKIADHEQAMFWLLNLSDGNHDLIDISEKSHISFETLLGVAKKLEENKLLKVSASSAKTRKRVT